MTPKQGRDLGRREFNRIVAASFAGLVLGAAGCTAGEASEADADTKELGPGEHACKGLNECKGQGGCGDTKGKNECAAKGGCATIEHHACGGQNSCKGRGGCGSKKGTNECKGKGGCAVPIRH